MWIRARASHSGGIELKGDDAFTKLSNLLALDGERSFRYVNDNQPGTITISARSLPGCGREWIRLSWSPEKSSGRWGAIVYWVDPGKAPREFIYQGGNPAKDTTMLSAIESGAAQPIMTAQPAADDLSKASATESRSSATTDAAA